MRFLHTADWHIGKPLRGRSRIEEHAAALDEVHRIALDQKVDAVLVAGDVFDSPAPPPDAERLVYDLLARLLPERIACVLIAGNHDHPRKLGALTALLERLRIHVRAEVRAPDQGGVVALTSRDGTEDARVAVLPFVPERRVVDACAIMDAEYKWYEAYAQRIEQILGALVSGLGVETVNLILGHVLVDGARRGTGERELHLGQVYGINPQRLPSRVQYIGLGHLHRYQEILAPAKTFYAGSLIELDFGEKEQDKRVIVVEARPGRGAVVTPIPVMAGRRLRDVRGTLSELEAQAADLGDAFLRVTVTTADAMPGVADRVREMLPNALEVAVHFEGKDDPRRPVEPRGPRDPRDLFASYYRLRNGQEPGPEVLRVFDEVHEEALA